MAIDLLDRGVVNIDPLTSDVRGIDLGPEAFAQLRQAANLVKVLLTSTGHSRSSFFCSRRPLTRDVTGGHTDFY